MQGVIEHQLSAFLKRQISRAVDSDTKTIVFEINSPGGLLYDSIDLATAIADLDKAGIRTIAYVPREAISGAAIIALGCDEIYLEPNAKIGDAGPIEIQDGGMFASGTGEGLELPQAQPPAARGTEETPGGRCHRHGGQGP